MLTAACFVVTLTLAGGRTAAPVQPDRLDTAIADLSLTLDSHPHYVRQVRAAEYLASLGPAAEPAIPALIRLLNQPMPILSDHTPEPLPVARAAVDGARKALVAIGSAAVPALVEELAKQQQSGYESAKALGELQDDRAILPLVNALHIHGFAASQALIGFKSAAVGEAVASRLGDPATRKTVIDILVERRDMRALPALLEDLSTGTGYRQREVLQLIAHLRPPDGRKYVLPVLKNPDPWVRAYVGVALGSLGTAQDVPSLIQMLKADHYMERWGAAVGLGRLKDRRALQPLIDARRIEKEGSTRQGMTDAIALLRKAR